MLESILTYSFMRNAFIAAILASIICGIIGTIIVKKKMVMMSGGIAHASFGGVGLGFYLGFEPIYGALFFSLLAALGLYQIQKKVEENPDVFMGMFWSFGMALGILFIRMTPGYPPDMNSYLFGDILSVPSFMLFVMLAVSIMISLFIFGLFPYWRAFIFDEEFAKVVDIPVKVFKICLYIMISLSVVLLIRVVGIILTVALLTVPTAVASMFSNRLKTIIVLSNIFCVMFCIAGLMLSYWLSIPSGASIVITSVFFYIVIISLKSINKLAQFKVNSKASDHDLDSI